MENMTEHVFCLNNTHTFYHFRLSVNREFKTAQMWISSVNHEKKTARKFPCLQYKYIYRSSSNLFTLQYN